MKLSSSIHNHTTFCDGKSSAEEMIVEAINQGLKTIGFSAHSYTPCDPSYCLRDTDGYFEELTRLKEKYKDQIDVLIGLEVDCYGDKDTRADYAIMSVHNVMLGDKLYIVDYSLEQLKSCVEESFSGDVYSLVEAYYNTVEQSIDRGGFDIVGHLDLIAKYNEKYPIIDENNPRYISAVKRVLAKLDGKGIPLELNTGGVYRGYKKDYYPSTAILKIVREYDIPLIITSDAHTKDGLSFDFDNALIRLKSLGYKSVVELTKEGLKELFI